MVCHWTAPLAVVYFAVGPAALRKAVRSAVSARGHGGPLVETMLVTDEHGAKRVRRWMLRLRRTARAARNATAVHVDAGSSSSHAAFFFFDAIETLGRNLSEREFQATREVVGSTLDATATALKWKDKRTHRASNDALRALRAAKVEAIRRALRRYERAVFFDADTFVCSSLGDIACALDPPAIAAFAPVERGREHGVALLARSSRWRVPAHAREANTGVLAVRNDSASASSSADRLLDAWRDAYADLSAGGFLMDQPAFRAALHATRAQYVLLPRRFNCRGHQRRDAAAKPGASSHRAAVALRCRGFDDLEPGVQTTLRGGAGCVVLHSHDIDEPWPPGVGVSSGDGETPPARA